ncbi:MAG: NADH-quinone oxidoreductase subunit H [Holophagaceae bacterium]|nr:NADH-quinone oxidoreductase subunit H [Holophagaceae bacterium]
MMSINLSSIALLAAHAATAILVPPILVGAIAKVKALMAGRKGPPLLQIYRNIAKLMKKNIVLSTASTWIFMAGPIAVAATGLGVSLMVPMGGADAPISFAGDMIFAVFLIAMGRFMSLLAALDTGNSFEGMGAAREATWSALAEPALFLGLGAVAYFSGHTSLAPAFYNAGLAWGNASGPFILVMAGWMIIFLAENARMPFDDPSAHLELAMIHESVLLDHSGPLRGIAIYGASLKLLVTGTFLVRLCLPIKSVWWIDWPAYFGGLALLALSIAVIESILARLKLARVPQLLVAAILACTFGFLLLFLEPR